MRCIIPILFSLVLVGCGEDRILPPITPPIGGNTLPPVEQPKAGKDGKVDPLEQAKADAQRYSELAAQAEARVETLTKQKAEESLRAQVNWISGICLLIAAIAGIAAFVVPLGKKMLVAGAVGCVAVAACAQAFAWAVPYLPWIGGAALVGGGIWAAINWRKLGDAVKVAADHGDRIESWLDDLPEEVRVQAQKVISDAKIETQQQARRLGVHTDIQYLRGKTTTAIQRLLGTKP